MSLNFVVDNVYVASLERLLFFNFCEFASVFISFFFFYLSKHFLFTAMILNFFCSESFRVTAYSQKRNQEAAVRLKHAVSYCFLKLYAQQLENRLKKSKK